MSNPGAGRPQFDDTGVACVFVHDSKKNFFKKFLHEPFPVESSLHKNLHNHLIAEIVGEIVSSRQDAVEYLTWTYLYRRIQVVCSSLTLNPTYYGVLDFSEKGINKQLSLLVDSTLADLEVAGCVELDQDSVSATVIGQIASFYYLSYKTAGLYYKCLNRDYKPEDFPSLLRLLADAFEYAELPVRHNGIVLC